MHASRAGRPAAQSAPALGVRVPMAVELKPLVFGVVWVVLLCGGVLWDRSATPAQKIRAMPYFTAIGTLVFLLGGFWASDSWGMAYWVVPAVCLVAFTWYKVMRICLSCGKVHMPLSLIPRRHCSACGNQVTKPAP